jgi:hypothetical protein
MADGRSALQARDFSATVMSGTGMECWWTIPMPSATTSCGELMSTGRLPTKIDPESGL